MDLNRANGPGSRARQAFEQTKREVNRSNSERVRDAREALARLSEIRAQRLESAREVQNDARVEAARRASANNSDQVQISNRGRMLADQVERREPADGGDRAERIAELKARYQAGELNTPEAIDRAATRLLSGDE